MKRTTAVVFLATSFGWMFGAVAQDKPVVAVFDIETQGVDLSAEMLDRLSEYLGSRMAASGNYQVVPRAQIRERLVAQKKESYSTCFDQSCQIEIGKELAAEKSVATKLIKLGSRCTVTATLFDLKKAATENAATVHGGCSEDDIVVSLDKAVDQLTGAAEKTATPPPPAEKSEVAAAPEAAPPRPGAESHEGFFVRAAVGGGFGIDRVKDEEAEDNRIQGGANCSSVAIGYVVAENLAVHGSFFHAVLISPDSYKGDEKMANLPGRYLLTGVGGGVTYYFMPSNMFLSASLGLTILEAKIGLWEFKTEKGFGADLLFGKEWWIGDDWGLGIALQAIFGTVPSRFEESHTSFGAAVLCSLTYN